MAREQLLPSALEQRRSTHVLTLEISEVRRNVARHVGGTEGGLEPRREILG